MTRPEPRRRVTLADIARACGVSPATVSLVLGGSPVVAAQTRRRVEAEIRRQGYVYNRSAANLRRKISTSVALVVNDLSNPFVAEFAAGVDEALAAAGCVMLLGSSGESVERQRAVLASLVEHGPAGVILTPADGTRADDLRPVVGLHTPLLLFNREVADGDWDYLGADNAAGARLATEHLLAQGHRRIAFFGGSRTSSSFRQRADGYRTALADAGVTPEPQWVVECPPTRVAASLATSALFARDPAPTAVVAYNDGVAFGLMMGLRARNIAPGRDFAITGFDDTPEACAQVPALTTLATAPRALGRQAVDIVLARGRAPDAPQRTTIAAVHLVERDSSLTYAHAPDDRGTRTSAPRPRDRSEPA
ncbi:LacI family DNA-binding transcriptional regulator [Luteimonas sp. FCS-9]|uniref:LacI family DNA-binding transcriptional regulator n=1 Tax=Luteimonas sp. FCS-9 TaxID=1547516 RepID=UPI00063E72D7|nr:LacI family DNA-binding transcriptional regulator [Luteimonas sp. FCS-9]KLJ00333.1 transcriptional regulator [Luteimonas sp. FCS-9]